MWTASHLSGQMIVCSETEDTPSQKDVTAYFSCEQPRPFGFAEVYLSTALQSQNAVSAYLYSKQILPFGFADLNTTHNLLLISATNHCQQST